MIKSKKLVYGCHVQSAIDLASDILYINYLDGYIK